MSTVCFYFILIWIKYKIMAITPDVIVTTNEHEPIVENGFIDWFAPIASKEYAKNIRTTINATNFIRPENTLTASLIDPHFAHFILELSGADVTDRIFGYPRIPDENKPMLVQYTWSRIQFMLNDLGNKILGPLDISEKERVKAQFEKVNGWAAKLRPEFDKYRPQMKTLNGLLENVTTIQGLVDATTCIGFFMPEDEHMEPRSANKDPLSGLDLLEVAVLNYEKDMGSDPLLPPALRNASDQDKSRIQFRRIAAKLDMLLNQDKNMKDESLKALREWALAKRLNELPNRIKPLCDYTGKPNPEATAEDATRYFVHWMNLGGFVDDEQVAAQVTRVRHLQAAYDFEDDTSAKVDIANILRSELLEQKGQMLKYTNQIKLGVVKKLEQNLGLQGKDLSEQEILMRARVFDSEKVKTQLEYITKLQNKASESEKMLGALQSFSGMGRNLDRGEIEKEGARVFKVGARELKVKILMEKGTTKRLGAGEMITTPETADTRERLDQGLELIDTPIGTVLLSAAKGPTTKYRQCEDVVGIRVVSDTSVDIVGCDGVGGASNGKEAARVSHELILRHGFVPDTLRDLKSKLKAIFPGFKEEHAPGATAAYARVQAQSPDNFTYQPASIGDAMNLVIVNDSATPRILLIDGGDSALTQNVPLRYNSKDAYSLLTHLARMTMGAVNSYMGEDLINKQEKRVYNIPNGSLILQMSDGVADNLSPENILQIWKASKRNITRFYLMVSDYLDERMQFASQSGFTARMETHFQQLLDKQPFIDPNDPTKGRVGLDIIDPDHMFGEGNLAPDASEVAYTTFPKIDNMFLAATVVGHTV